MTSVRVRLLGIIRRSKLPNHRWPGVSFATETGQRDGWRYQLLKQMKEIELQCPLCGSPREESVLREDGHRHHITCQSSRCGRFVITSGALGRLETGGPQKSVLIEMVRRANLHGKALEIFVAGDGLLQATELPRI